MKSPHCPLCNKNHWPREPHDFSGVEIPKKVVGGPRGPAAVVLASQKAAVAKLSLPGGSKVEDRREGAQEKSKGKRGRPKTVFDFKAHRKDYMRAYRARKGANE